MLQKVKSIFLLFLFWLVILFPGYTQQPPMQRKTCAVICKKEKNTVSVLRLILKKCLSSGISGTSPVNEEERTPSSNEEETGSHSCPDGFIIPAGIKLYGIEINPVSYFHHDSPRHLFFEEIPSPPPNLI